jgi:peptide/nickel transport system substrate-binding protein
MRRLLLLLLVLAIGMVPSACRKRPHGDIKVVTIGGTPQIRDPALGPLPQPDAVLLGSVAQGLVRFDAAGNIVPGLAERWNVSDDGLSYIFRIASAQWPDGRKINAQQVARILNRYLAQNSRDPIKDTLGAVENVIAMTDRVIEIQLIAPRPNLLPLLAQPEFAILRGTSGTGPFNYSPVLKQPGVLRLSREVGSPDEETTRRDSLLLSGATAAQAVAAFADDQSDLVLGGTFNDLAYVRRVKLPRDSLHFDPASGLFGLVPTRSGGSLDDPNLRKILSQAINRDAFVSSLNVPGLSPRVTLLEPGLDGLPAPVVPAWVGTPLGTRLSALRTQADTKFGHAPKPKIRVSLPKGPGGELLLQTLMRDWGALGFIVEWAPGPASADFVLIDEVAPSSSPAWFVRRFRCGAVPVCDSDMDDLIEAARISQSPAQRYALLAQAAQKIEDKQLFIPITAPVRWSLTSRRIENFAGNRYARHTLTDLDQKPGADD